ncbi:MAG: hypothetical protein NWE92_11470 [Candidatus Bathyarchaeota archaeon]|nr:hypothetical protein [Candidatus Bathyarchaeota archaeon]
MKSKITPIEIGKLSNVKCSICGRFLSEYSIKGNGKYPTMCTRCVLNTPAVKEIASTGNNERILAALVKQWDIDYEKELEKKFAKIIRRKPTAVEPQ